MLRKKSGKTAPAHCKNRRNLIKYKSDQKIVVWRIMTAGNGFIRSAISGAGRRNA